MFDLISQVVVLIRGAARFRWHALAAAWALALIGWGIVFAMPDTYRARAKVYVDTESVLKPLLQGLAVGSDVSTQVNMMSTVMMSRPHLEKVAHDTDLYTRASTRKEFDSLIDDLARRIELEAGTPKNTYTIAFADSDPAMAARVVQTLLKTFVEDSLGIKRADSNSAQQFLEQQIKEYEGRLRAAEERLADFKKQNVGLIPGQTGDYYTRMQTEMTNLATLRSSFQVASEKRTELVRQLAGEEPTFGLVTAPQRGTASALDVRIAELNQKLDSLLVQYTDKHPDVIAIRESIAQLQEEKKRSADKQAAALTGSTVVDPNRIALSALDVNPVYQATKISLGQTEVELVELRSQIGAAEARVSDLRARVNTIPEVEAQLSRLNRDYEVNRAEHTALLQRLESARLSGEAEQSSTNVRFRVIEPPFKPLTPIAPNRPVLLSLVLVLALGAGLAIAIAMSLAQPVFGSRAFLRSATGLPVIGSISLALPKGARFLSRKALAYGATAALLLVCYGVALAVARFAPHSF
ncbi:MAG TPA: XrtA system polysaccharide chain length determinant [Steroidobacteraceae bacterium]|nr:XrtA system polysaccharide chain length determinant [Steroidobacteraceae bacterium]